LKNIALLILAVLAIGAGAAFAAKPVQHQHYANFGPWCISKSSGVMRAVRGVQACRQGEVRVGHKRIPLDAVAGPQGLPGSAGLPGAAGKDGSPGTPGPAGPQGGKGDAGAPGQIGPQGPDGAPGKDGATGATGPAGATAAPGRIVELCVSPGGNVKEGHCDPGHGDTIPLYGP
jgi:hypothetical protein